MAARGGVDALALVAAYGTIVHRERLTAVQAASLAGAMGGPYLQPYTPVEWGLIAFIVVAATLVPFALFLFGLRFVDSRTASLTATIEPVVAAGVAAVFIGGALAGRGIAGAALILGSLILVQVLPPVPPKAAVTNLTAGR